MRRFLLERRKAYDPHKKTTAKRMSSTLAPGSYHVSSKLTELTFSLTFSKEEGDTTEKHTRKTSV